MGHERELLAGATTEVTRIGPAVDKTDGVTPSTALSFSASDLRLSKNGGAFASATSSVVSSTEYGYYSVAWGSTDIDTPGDLTVAVNWPTTILPLRHVYKIRSQNVYDALHLQTSYLEVDAQQVAGATPITAQDVSDQVSADMTTVVSAAVWTSTDGGVSTTEIAAAVWSTLQGGEGTTSVADAVWANSAVPANFSTLAINTSGEVTLGTDNSINGYWAKMRRNPAGEITGRWYYRDQPLDTGCTSPTISLINRDFTTLLASTPMSQDGVTGRVTYDAAVSSTSALYIRMAITHGGTQRVWEDPYLRDT